MGAAGIERVEAAEAARIEAERAPAARPSLTALELAQRDDAALREDIGRFGQALRAVEGEKAELARRLGRAEAELARRRSGEASAPQRDAFDLDRTDWKKLAAEGAVKFRRPCTRQGGWTPGENDLNRLGLAPDDAEVIRAAFERSNDRVWSAVRPLCIEALGSEVVVDTIGTDTCIHGVMNVAKAADLESTRAAMREVAETRAGERPAPTPGPTGHPVFELFWTLTGETAALEADLTENLGPEDAKRIARSPDTCSNTSSYSVGK